MKLKLSLEIEIPDSGTEFGEQIGHYIYYEDYDSDDDLEYNIVELIEEQLPDNWDKMIDFSPISKKYRHDYQIAINKYKNL
jgi:hypothetical protein